MSTVSNTDLVLPKYLPKHVRKNAVIPKIYTSPDPWLICFISCTGG